MKTSDELQEAVRSFRQGDRESFNRIYELSYRYLHTCVIHVVKDEDTAMDMLQETYMEISRSISQLKNTEDFLNWAAAISNRKCFACLKKDRDMLVYESETDTGGNRTIFDNLADDDAVIPEEILQDREKQRLIREIIDNLSDMQRLCVIGYFYNEQKQEEIAEELGIPLNTVKTHLSRAKASIREAIIDMDVKKDTRLYSFAAFMLLFFGSEAEACELKQMDIDISEETKEPDAAKKPQKERRAKIAIGALAAGGILAAVLMPSIKGAQGTSIQTRSQDVDEEQSALSEEQNTMLTEIQEMTAEITDETASESAVPGTEESIAGYPISEQYYAYGRASQGLIPVWNAEGKCGLVTYDNQVVVPLVYSEGCGMVNGEGQSFFGDADGYTVFDRDGNALFHTERTVRSVNDGVVFAMDGWGFDAGFAYFNLDGSVICESGEDGEERGAVGFNEGYAFMYDLGTERLSKDGTVESMSDLVFPENLTAGQRASESDDESRIIVDVVGISFVMDIPIGAANGGYYFSRGPEGSSDSYGIFTLRSIDGQSAYSWDISNIFSRENLTFSTSDAYWDFTGYYDNGNIYCNNGTYLCAYIDVDGKKVYYLADVSKMTWRDYVPSGEYGSDEDYWDFDHTPLTEEALIARADYIGLNGENYWLIKQEGKWGYIDHAGNVMGMYDDAAAFYGGKALVLEDGTAYVIDESFSRIREIGPADSVTNYGELFAVRNTGELFGQMIRLD